VIPVRQQRNHHVIPRSDFPQEEPGLTPAEVKDA
jgi:hypothetical protein